jgi:hypothetical protein
MPRIVVVLLVTGGFSPHATADVPSDNSPQLRPHGTTLMLRDQVTQIDSKAPTVLRIENIRLEPARGTEAASAALLKFEMFNASASRLTDVVLEVSILEAPRSNHASARPRLVAGPFTIRGNVTRDSGYTLNYEILLRNLSPHCHCLGKVDVLAVRSLSKDSVSR